MKEEVCCPKFNSEIWDDKILEWNDKKFIKGRVKTFMYVPIGFGKEMTRLQKLVDNQNARIEDYMSLSIHPTKWNMELCLAVNEEINGADNFTLTGKYYSKVYEGSFSDTAKWISDFENIIKEKEYNCDIKKIYMWYTTCPKCAKKYGKNYVVIIGKID
jgi:hypothetical protein